MEGGIAIKHILMFLKDTGLHASFKKLVEEAEISYNWIKDPEKLVSDLKEDNYAQVFVDLDYLCIPFEIIMDIYEIACYYFVQAHEYDAALHLLLNSQSAPLMKKEFDSRYYAYLQSIKNRAPLLLLGNATYQDRKADITKRLLSYIEKAPSSIFAEGNKPTVEVAEVITEKAEYAQRIVNFIQLKEEAKAECCDICANMLAIGTSDGFVQIYDTEQLSIPSELSYQVDKPLINGKKLISVSFSNDGRLLASGDIDGNIKVWKVSDGVLVRNIERAHLKAIGAIKFVKNNNMLLTASHDFSIKLYGLKSCQMMKEFKAHESFINGLRLMSDEVFISYSSDGSIIKWCLTQPNPINKSQSGSIICNPSIICVDINPANNNELLVIERSNRIKILDDSLQYCCDFGLAISSSVFIGGCFSANGKYIYCANDDGNIYIFERSKKCLKSNIKVSKNKIMYIGRHSEDIIYTDSSGIIGRVQ